MSKLRQHELETSFLLSFFNADLSQKKFHLVFNSDYINSYVE
jgi:hypothetical protein